MRDAVVCRRAAPPRGGRLTCLDPERLKMSSEWRERVRRAPPASDVSARCAATRRGKRSGTTAAFMTATSGSAFPETTRSRTSLRPGRGRPAAPVRAAAYGGRLLSRACLLCVERAAPRRATPDLQSNSLAVLDVSEEEYREPVGWVVFKSEHRLHRTLSSPGAVLFLQKPQRSVGDGPKCEGDGD